MTPEEQAVALLENMCHAVGSYINKSVFGIGKSSALIAVDIIIEELALSGCTDSSRYVYWREVKAEITKMELQ